MHPAVHADYANDVVAVAVAVVAGADGGDVARVADAAQAPFYRIRPPNYHEH